MNGLRISILCVLLPSVAGATVLWRGDLETGDRSQFSHEDMVSADRLQVMRDPVAQGEYALKVTVVQGDNPNGASGNRNEMVKMTNDPEGSEYYYSWSTFFPNDYPSVNTWQVFAQWHHPTCCGSPPIAFYTYGDQIRLDMGATGDYRGFTPWWTPLIRGRWSKFTAHIHWSADASLGWMEVFYNGKLAMPRTYGFTGALTYLKMGLYRDASVWQTESIYQDGMVKADALEDVESTPVIAPPEAVDGGATASESAPLIPVDDAGVAASPVGASLRLARVSKVGEAAVNGGTGCTASGGGLGGLLALLALAQVTRRRRGAQSGS